jgi:hypothetical protein
MLREQTISISRKALRPPSKQERIVKVFFDTGMIDVLTQVAKVF